MIPQQKKNEAQPRDRRRTVLRHEISFSTMMQAVLFAAGIWVLIELLPVVLVLVVALIIVGTMSPAVHWLKIHGMRRGAGITIVFMAFVIAAILIGTLSIPAIVQQAANLIEQEPALRAHLVDFLAGSRLTAPFADALGEISDDVLMKTAAMTLFSYSARIVEIIAYSAAVFFLALYIMIDHNRLRGGLYAIVPRSHHMRLSHILLHMETIVGGYMRGQVIISALMAIFVFVLLTAFRVPNALAISVFAGLVDVLPYIGVFLSMAPTVLAALSQGPAVTITVLVLMLAYEEFESRVLVPRIYGRAMRLPSSVVLFAILAGGTLMGIVGAFLALPAAATIRMLIDEFGGRLPGESVQVWGMKHRRKEDRSEEEYLRRTDGLPTEEAAAIAVEISRAIQQEEAARYETFLADEQGD
ncbi:MAG TPA: AI-2E family transporter [Nitrospirota bacterium]|nr:AI-2E family transporter [Nitrospirota bacterium]